MSTIIKTWYDETIRGICVQIVLQKKWEFIPLGSWIIIAPCLILTTRHIFEEINTNDIILCLQYISENKGHIIRECKELIRLNSNTGVLDCDLCFLKTKAIPTLQSIHMPQSYNITVHKLIFDINPPKTWENLIAFGYWASSIKVNSENQWVERDSSWYTSTGNVSDIHIGWRDKVLAPFSWIACEFDSIPWMSWGIVVNEQWRIIGLISRWGEGGFKDYCYVSLIRPALWTTINYDYKWKTYKNILEMWDLIKLENKDLVKLNEDHLVFSLY